MTQKESDKKISRRKLLRNCSAGAGIGIAGLSGNALAAKPTEHKEIKKIEQSPEVRSILSDLGLNKIPNKHTAETAEINGDKLSLKTTKVDFGYGQLLVGDLNGDITTVFSLDETSQKQVPGDKYDNIPSGTEAWIYGSADGTTFLRTTTDTEREAALSTVSVKDVDSVITYIRSDINTLRVDVTDPEEAGLDPTEYEIKNEPTTMGPESSSTNVPTNEFIRFEITLGGVDTASFSPESTELQPASISGPARVVAQKVATSLGFASLGALTDSCEVKAAGCLASFIGSISGCIKCAPACVGSPTGIGIPICILCVFGVCGYLLSAYSCTVAMDCFANA
ncbi:hypothetical protein ACH9L7_18360 (plasmid) [Haloferax sp. S1W]|uniref:hypothetical protein n=1 Tax=Haloferax sp. S1W TaxID=3377110 RepID=UPI0037C85EA0